MVQCPILDNLQVHQYLQIGLRRKVDTFLLTYLDDEMSCPPFWLITIKTVRDKRVSVCDSRVVKCLCCNIFYIQHAFQRIMIMFIGLYIYIYNTWPNFGLAISMLSSLLLSVETMTMSCTRECFETRRQRLVTLS